MDGRNWPRKHALSTTASHLQTMDKRPVDTLADASQQEDIATHQQPQPRTKRTRIRQACQRCTKRKTKCNNSRPCAACTAAGVQCTDWRPGEEHTIASHSYANASGDVEYDFAQPVSLNEFDQLVDPTLRPQMGQQLSTDVWPNVPANDRHQRPPFTYDRLYRNERGLLEHASASDGVGHLAYLARLQSGNTGAGSISPWPNPENERPVPLPATSNLYDLVEARLGWKIMIMLVRPFLETNYVMWPTFHLPGFLSSLASVRLNQDPEFICLLLGIAYMALRERRTRKDLSEDTADEFADLYWEIRNAEVGRDWSSLAAIQGMLYLSIGYMGGAWHKGAELGRKTLSDAVTRCLDVGMHRSLDSGSMPVIELEERRRTLWAVYCLDKSVAISGRPALLRLSDIDQGEITILDPTLQERIAPEMPSLLAYHRIAIRLYMILERILAKINMPSCGTSSAIRAISRPMGVRRYDETSSHNPTCEADHRSSDFSVELRLLDQYQYSDIPLPSRSVEEDPMYHRHLARIRTMSAFCRLLIASHLFSVAASDRQLGNAPDMKQAAGILRWSDEIIESQRPAVEKGVFPDYGSSTVTEIAHVASSLLAVIHILQLENPVDPPVSLFACMNTFHSAISLLRTLRARFDIVIKHLDPLEHYAVQLGVSLPPLEAKTAHPYQPFAPNSKDDASMNLPGLDEKTGEQLVSEALGVLASETANAETPQPGQSGSGAIQALLSLSGRTGEGEGGGVAGSEGLEAWWASLLSGNASGTSDVLDERFTT